jgi:hypothetical protein
LFTFWSGKNVSGRKCRSGGILDELPPKCSPSGAESQNSQSPRSLSYVVCSGMNLLYRSNHLTGPAGKGSQFMSPCSPVKVFSLLALGVPGRACWCDAGLASTGREGHQQRCLFGKYSLGLPVNVCSLQVSGPQDVVFKMILYDTR